MLFRRSGEDLYTPVALDDSYSGCPVFVLGGNPILKDLPLDKLERSRLVTLALNNVPYTYPNPTMWLTADKPVCYGGHFFARPDIIKFAYMNYRDEVVQATGRPLKDHPMTLLYTAAEAMSYEDFFSDGPAFAWWKSVFPLSLQMSWRLGARRVYLVGCSFSTQQSRPYAWDAKLDGDQTKWSQMTYNQDIDRLRRLAPLFKSRGFEVISCTPDSKANGLFPYVPLGDAISYERGRRPRATPLGELKHSSEFRPRGS